MKYIFSLASIFLIVTLSIFGVIQQDLELVHKLQENKVCLIVMRHGEAIHNLSHLMLSTRSPMIYLTPRGVEQVEKSAGRLSELHVDCIYVSPLFRTLQTAQIVGSKLLMDHQQVCVDDRLREQYFGDFEGYNSTDFRAYFPNKGAEYTDAPPHGESGNEVFERTRDLLWEIANKHSHSTVLLVTHGIICLDVNQCLTGSYKEMSKQAEYTVFDYRD